MPARPRALVRRLAGGVRPLCAEMVERGTFMRLKPEKRPNTFSPLGPRRRRAGRGPHLHLQREHEDAGPTNNWMHPAEMKATWTACSTAHARAHDVRDPVQHGAARLADRPYRRRAHRHALRRRQHADHDPHGQAVLDVLGDGDFVPCLHSVGRRCEPGQEDVPWPCNQGREVHRALPRGAHRSGRTAAATAATRCSARSASRCGSPRSWRATRAGWPSTC